MPARMQRLRQPPEWLLVALIASVAVFGMLNSFSSRIRAQAFGSSNYVVTIYNTAFQTAAYLIAYVVLTAYGWIPRGQLTSLFRCSGWRWRALGLAKYLIIAGASDVADNVTGFTAEPHLSTLTYALMNQTTVPFTVLFSLLLGTCYSACELFSVLIVVCAGAACVLIGEGHAEGGHDSAGWAVFAALTTSFAAVSYLLKEATFREYGRSQTAHADTGALLHNEANSCAIECASPIAATGTRGRTEPARGAEGEESLSFVTVSVVVQVVSLLTCVPIVLANRAYANGVAHDAMPPMSEALTCLWTCEHAAVSFAFYTAINLLWNGALLLLTQHGSALLAFLALKLQVPLVAIFSSLPWPLIGAHAASPLQWTTLCAMAAGIAGYQWGRHRRSRREVDGGDGAESRSRVWPEEIRTGTPPSRAAVAPLSLESAGVAETDALLERLPSSEYELTFGSGTHSKRDGPPPAPTRVRIYDARNAASRVTLQDHGVQLVRMPAYGECDFYDGAQTTASFYPAAEQLLLEQIPGATRVLIFDHLLRNLRKHSVELDEAKRTALCSSTAAPTDMQPKTRFLEKPLGAVHGDYTARSGRTRAKQLLEPYCTAEELEHALSSRFALVNVWHHFGPQPVAADPMAFAMWGSYGPRDVYTKRLTFPHRIGETYQGIYSPRQRWIHYSAVTRQEAILIKTFDSLDDGRTARFSLHSAFRYPEQDGPHAASLPVRESIELRALVLYGAGLEQIAPRFSNVSMPAHDSPMRVHELARLTELEIYNLLSSELLPAGDEW